ncbi:MAG: peroxide stress protein YaaA [Clostridiales bacterium]|nr:peroxide stress protein YaaA [Clostridiales bacterium]
MRIIISPAKKMKKDTDSLSYHQLPQFIEESECLLSYIKRLRRPELKLLWQCSDNIAELNHNRMYSMDLFERLTPALIAYEGIQYQRMAAGVLETDEYAYLEKHLRILSGFYGLLRPFDGVAPYRLEMKAKMKGDDFSSLYEFWSTKIADQLFSESHCIVNLASKEYSQCVSRHLNPDIRFVTCIFGEIIEGKVIEKGTLVKMARGEMVKFMAENKIETVEGLKAFKTSGYVFDEDLSDHDTFIFLRKII